jgi:hypothetical protein
MRIARSVRIFTFVAAVFAVLMLAAPGYSWNGRYHHGNGGHYNHGYHHGYRHYGHGNWNGYYGARSYPYYRSYYYAPSVSFGFPFFLPGFSFYFGP